MGGKLIKILMVVAVVVGVLNTPILHQNLETGRVYFSLVDAIESDIVEQQLNTPFFIMTSIKDLF